MLVDNQKIMQFLNYIEYQNDHAAMSDKIQSFLQAQTVPAYILFRNNSLYFFKDEATTPQITAIKTQYAELDYVRFDGQHISRVDPDYYLGYQSQSVGIEHELQQRSEIAKGRNSTNNNNNNNNNNGNNNG
jgi:hypothetical protein